MESAGRAGAFGRHSVLSAEALPVDNPTDGDLVRRAKQGDFEAFDELVTRHERRLYGLVLRMVRQAQDAEDVVQTAFLNALEHLDSFREDASFSTWITRIATNTALKVIRKRKGLPVVPTGVPKTEEEEGVIQRPEFIADWRENPAELAQRRETGEIMSRAVDSISEKLRLVFLLRDVAGLNIQETAEALGISSANVKVRLLRARLALREYLTQAFGDREKRVIPDHSHGEEEATPARELLKSYLEA